MQVGAQDFLVVLASGPRHGEHLLQVPADELRGGGDQDASRAWGPRPGASPALVGPRRAGARRTLE